MRQENTSGALAKAPRRILISIGAYLMVDLCVLYLWNSGCQVFAIQGATDSPAGLSVIVMACVGLYLNVVVLRGFEAGGALRPAWMLLTLAAAAQTASGLWVELAAPDGLAARIAGGPVRLALLAGALLVVLRTMRRFGFRVRPNATDWAVFALVCLFALCRFVEGGLADWTSLAGLPVLCVLFLEAILLRRSVLPMGNGPIAKCWAAFAYGIFLTGFAELAFWMVPHYSHAWPASSIASLTRFPIAAVFALAPAYQLMAQRRAKDPAADAAGDLATSVPAMAR